MVRDSIVYVSILLMTLIFMIQSNAKIDPKSAAGVWLFDEESGKVAKDSSDNGYDGKFMGKGNPKWVDGKFGKALDFNGSTDYVEVDSEPGLNITGDITVVAWIFKRPAGRVQFSANGDRLATFGHMSFMIGENLAAVGGCVGMIRAKPIWKVRTRS